MILLFNGCSHTFGQNRTHPYCTYSNMILKYFDKKSKLFYNKTDEWIPFSSEAEFRYSKFEEFNRISGTKGYNMASRGKGNEAIFLETLECVEYLISKKEKPDYVFVQWSGPSRNLSLDYLDRYDWVTPYDFNREYTLYEPEASRKTIYFIYLLQSILEKYKIKYSFICYQKLEENIKNNIIFNKIDKSTFAVNQDDITVGMIDTFRKNGMVLDAQGHPNTLGNYYLFEKLLKNLNINNSNFGIMNFLNFYCEGFEKNMLSLKFITNEFYTDIIPLSKKSIKQKNLDSYILNFFDRVRNKKIH